MAQSYVGRRRISKGIRKVIRRFNLAIRMAQSPGKAAQSRSERPRSWAVGTGTNCRISSKVL